MKCQITCKLVMVLPMKLSTTELAFVQLVQDGSQNKSQCCINKCAWTSANKIWIAMIKKVRPSWTETSLVTKHGSTITSRSVNSRLWNGNFHNSPSEKVQKPTISRNIDAYSFLGHTRPNTEHCQERCSTINSARYSEMLIDRLKPEI